MSGTSLLVQLEKAIKMREKHQQVFEEFNESFPKTVIERWQQMLGNWNIDHSRPNPYEEPVIGKVFPCTLNSSDRNQ
jgi:hypothetical protein